MRLDKFLCKSTDYSRKQAIAQIEQGEVTVNGETITTPETQVHENNTILLDSQRLIARPSRYIMLNKPIDTLCSNVDGDYPSVMNCVDIERACDLHIAGRLDADTTGLVLITDDGRWSFNIINPKYHCEKVYRVSLRDAITAAEAVELKARFAKGLQLQGEAKLTLPAKLEVVTSKEVLLTISEGRYHQVKRMFFTVGNRVVGLHRQQVGKLKLDIEVGQWRYLTEDEVSGFNN
ncbi:pseudouridine synthase [Shewanella eurypsychrophilus]|uniref:Pseudouridine synthase n=1 Tax=Shewanella eurypsychrophilus TaxID=2593656 RepID=A0ABX6V8Q9_9GAMM|nr:MULTISPECIES: pseudouridine synthase [Shewanella]QFU23788.1 pseudouridine synthase [Shewanella sp. YLB-09]QPG59011.1 pseudouridine synthase [Shewanella eurypsychrophilus]